jgi:hypothetical protein
MCELAHILFLDNIIAVFVFGLCMIEYATCTSIGNVVGSCIQSQNKFYVPGNYISINHIAVKECVGKGEGVLMKPAKKFYFL